MSEKLIETVVTKNDLKFALKHLGVKSSDACLVHTAMSKLQYLPGGSEIIVKALEETLVNGTLMMPSQVSMNCDPATWEYPPVRKDLIQVIQDAQCHLTMRKHLQLKVQGLRQNISATYPMLLEATIPRKVETCSAATGTDDNGKTVWTEYKNVDPDTYDDFNDLGQAFEKQFSNEQQSTKLSKATIKVINVVPLIDFALQWFEKKDKQFGNSID